MIKEILERYYNGITLKPLQEEIITTLFHEDCIGILPTGYGKSITFQIPALMFEGITLVITPLIALMQDQVEALKRRKIPAEYINSLQDSVEQKMIYEKCAKGKIKILYVSAERLFTKKFLEFLQKTTISFLVCDEAHTLLWSEDFRASMGKISSFLTILPYRPRLLALTATASKETLLKIQKYFPLKEPKIIIGNCDRNTIYYKVVPTSKKEKILFEYLSSHKQKGLIYTATIQKANYLYDLLKNNGFIVGIFHGEMKADLKKKMYMDYKENQLSLLVCTNAFGMGIDIPNIRFVLIYDLPSSIEDFVQQAGRSSRDGKKSETVLFFDTKDIKTQKYFIEHIPSNGRNEKEIHQIKKEKYGRLDKMIEFCLSKKCLHQFICNYFGEPHLGKCGMCMNCKSVKK